MADGGEHEHPEGGILGRLQHDRVPGAEGRRDLERGEEHRRVPGDDRPHHPDRLAAGVAEDVLAEGQGLALELAREPAEVAEDVRGERCLGPRLGAERVAGLGGDGAGEVLGPCLHRIGDPEEHPAAFARRHFAPGPRTRPPPPSPPESTSSGAGARHVGEDAAVGRVLDGGSSRPRRCRRSPRRAASGKRWQRRCPAWSRFLGSFGGGESVHRPAPTVNRTLREPGRQVASARASRGAGRVAGGGAVGLPCRALIEEDEHAATAHDAPGGRPATLHRLLHEDDRHGPAAHHRAPRAEVHPRLRGLRGREQERGGGARAHLQPRGIGLRPRHRVRAHRPRRR